TILEATWLTQNLPLAEPQNALAWGMIFYVVFLLFPFVFRRHMQGVGPWISSAIAGVTQWPLLWTAFDKMVGKPYMAIVPAFLALPSLGCLLGVMDHQKDETRISKLAWFGGITLLFVTLIIPIQFDKEWLTVGWTLEGAALLWLFRRVPHEGLKA